MSQSEGEREVFNGYMKIKYQVVVSYLHKAQWNSWNSEESQPFIKNFSEKLGGSGLRLLDFLYCSENSLFLSFVLLGI